METVLGAPGSSPLVLRCNISDFQRADSTTGRIAAPEELLNPSSGVAGEVRRLLPAAVASDTREQRRDDARVACVHQGAAVTQRLFEPLPLQSEEMLGGSGPTLIDGALVVAHDRGDEIVPIVVLYTPLPASLQGFGARGIELIRQRTTRGKTGEA